MTRETTGTTPAGSAGHWQARICPGRVLVAFWWLGQGLVILAVGAAALLLMMRVSLSLGVIVGTVTALALLLGWRSHRLPPAFVDSGWLTLGPAGAGWCEDGTAAAPRQPFRWLWRGSMLVGLRFDDRRTLWLTPGRMDPDAWRRLQVLLRLDPDRGG